MLGGGMCIFLHGLWPHKKHRMSIRWESLPENLLTSKLDADSQAGFPAL